MELKALSLHENALMFRAQRNQVLAANIANTDTPNYKARDLDFNAALQQAQGGRLRLSGTHELHLGTARTVNNDSANVKYRIPVQPSLDGNTVETDVEQAAFAENALLYRVSLAFLDGQIRTLKFAIRGGE